MEEKVVEGIALVKSSEYRRKILKTIGENILTPSEIARKIGIRLNHVSMFLHEMKNKGLVECLNEKAKKGRLYRLTGLGKNVIAKYG
jgi:predicted transcriptional regulator